MWRQKASGAMAAAAALMDGVHGALVLGPVVAALALTGRVPGGMHATGVVLKLSGCVADSSEAKSGGGHAMTGGSGGKGGGGKASGNPADQKPAAAPPPKLAMPGSARGKAPSHASPHGHRPPATKPNSARGSKKSDGGNPLGTGLGSARANKVPKPPSGISSARGGGTKSAQALNASAQASGAAQAPSARVSSAPPKALKPGAVKKQDAEPEPEKPWGLVNAPIPPLPPNIKKPPGLPVVSPAGARPRGRQDGAPSRHDLAPPTGWALLFNCFKAKFEIISGDASQVRAEPPSLVPVLAASALLLRTLLPECAGGRLCVVRGLSAHGCSQLSDHDPFDLKGPRSGASIGRIKISPEKGTSIVQRIEFPNEWLLAEVHGLQHDYYQGEGTLDLKVEWRKEGGVAEQIIIRVTPWLAYACSLGARMQMRKPGEAEGRMCTVQRVLPDDRCVVRVDGARTTRPVPPRPAPHAARIAHRMPAHTPPRLPARP